jgi:hypothetical protein
MHRRCFHFLYRRSSLEETSMDRSTVTVSCHVATFFHGVRKMLIFYKREVLGSGEKWLVFLCYYCSQWRTQEFCSGGGGGGFQQITVGRGDGGLGGGGPPPPPSQGFWRQL